MQRFHETSTWLKVKKFEKKHVFHKKIQGVHWKPFAQHYYKTNPYKVKSFWKNAFGASPQQTTDFQKYLQFSYETLQNKMRSEKTSEDPEDLSKICRRNNWPKLEEIAFARTRTTKTITVKPLFFEATGARHLWPALFCLWRRKNWSTPSADVKITTKFFSRTYRTKCMFWFTIPGKVVKF